MNETILNRTRLRPNSTASSPISNIRNSAVVEPATVTAVVGEDRTTSSSRPTRIIDVSSLIGTIEVTRAVYNRGVAVGNPIEALHTVRVTDFVGPTGRIRVEGSITRNLGDYNSVRVSVMVELPVYPEDSELRRAHAFASDLVDDLIAHELQLATQQESPAHG